MRIELFAARCLLVLCVEAGNSMWRNLCRRRMVVPRERRVFSRGCDTPVTDEWCRSILWRRWAGTNKIGVSDRGRFRAGRKRCSAENGRKQSNDVSSPSGRDGARLRGDVRVLGTSDGRHAATPAQNTGPLPATQNLAGQSHGINPSNSIRVWSTCGFQRVWSVRNYPRPSPASGDRPVCLIFILFAPGTMTGVPVDQFWPRVRIAFANQNLPGGWWWTVRKGKLIRTVSSS